MARGQPGLRITNQPVNRMRFRYGSEKGSHGALTGKDSSLKRKNFPSVKLENYFGNNVFIRASLYTANDPPERHIHRLRGPDCQDDGTCLIKLDKTYTAIFQNLSIEFVGKRELSNIIFERKKKELQLQYGSVDLSKVREIANEESKRMNLHYVKICFEAGIFEMGNHWTLLDRVFSDTIANQKSTDSGELKITRIDKCSGTCKGGDEIFLLCERVNKKDIKVKFFEEKDGKRIWEADGDFADSDVHHQVAIVFKTPPYKCTDINEAVKVSIQLYRPSDNEASIPLNFEYKPLLQDAMTYDIINKKRKTSHTDFQQRDDTSIFSIPQRSLNTANATYKDEGNGKYTEGGEKANFEKSDFSCIKLNSCPITKSSFSSSLINSTIINAVKGKFPPNPVESTTKGVTDNLKFIRNRKEEFLLPEMQFCRSDDNENVLYDFPEIKDTDMQDISYQSFEQLMDSILKDKSRDPVLGSTSEFFNPPSSIYSKFQRNEIYSDSVDKKVDDSLYDGMSQLNINEKFVEDNQSILKNEKESQKHLYEFSLWILKAFQDFVITGNIFYIFLSMRLMIKLPNDEGNNILHLSMIHQPKNLELLKCLLKVTETVPANIINHVNICKQTVLHLAVKCSSPSSIYSLLKSGCNPNLKDKDGNTAVHYAILYDEIECLKELIKFQNDFKIDFNILNFEGHSALHLAVKNGKCEQVQILCSGDININVIDGTTGRTALHYAVLFCPALINILLSQSEINVNPKDYSGNTPLHLAHSQKLPDVVCILNQQSPTLSIPSCEDSEESSFSTDDEVTDSTSCQRLLTDNPEDETENATSKANVSICSGYESRQVAFSDDSILDKVCRLLDPPSEDWKVLAEFLVDRQFVAVAEEYKSPTRALLKTCGGDAEYLRKMLDLAGLHHVVSLLPPPDAEVPSTSAR